ncbi:MAG: SIS domain-containing protein [Bdellovibrionales bacterium]|nr:SIS domain-containing protein [Bdellovibrionales bacterium]
MKTKIDSYIKSAQDASKHLSSCSGDIAAVAERLCSIFKGGGRLFTCGNGGSTCDAMHLVEELVARYKRERPGIRAHHLCDSATLTCWSNDYNFASAFARQTETLAAPSDALAVFSTSGNSDNIVQALKAAKKVGCTSIGFLGRDGGEAAKLCDISVIVPVQVTSHIQEAHAVIIHAVCEAVETTLFPEAK